MAICRIIKSRMTIINKGNIWKDQLSILIMTMFKDNT